MKGFLNRVPLQNLLTHRLYPPPYPPTKTRDSFWFGTEKLWTLLPGKGGWNGIQQSSFSGEHYACIRQ